MPLWAVESCRLRSSSDRSMVAESVRWHPDGLLTSKLVSNWFRSWTTDSDAVAGLNTAVLAINFRRKITRFGTHSLLSVCESSRRCQDQVVTTVQLINMNVYTTSRRPRSSQASRSRTPSSGTGIISYRHHMSDLIPPSLADSLHDIVSVWLTKPPS